MKSLILLFVLGAAIEASAALKVTNADDWKLDDVKDNKFAQFVVPGAESVLHRAIKLGEDKSFNMTITIRKVSKPSEEILEDNKEAWLRALFSAEKLKKITAPKEKQKIVEIDGQKRFISEISYRGESDTPLQAVVLGLKVGDDLYLVLFEQTGKLFHSHKKMAFELFRKMKIEEVAKEATAKSE